MKLFLFSIFLPLTIFAQMPDTDIWLVDIIKKEGKYSYEKPLNITKRVGYDNQPCFTLDNKGIYFVSVKEDKQADIYSYTINKKQISQITKTPESEYSPTVTNFNKMMSCVVVLKDSSQQILYYDLANKLPLTEISKGVLNTDSVGYSAWLNKDSLLYFKLTEPQSLRALNLKTYKDVWICNNPTRAFKKIGKSSQFMYGIKDSISVDFRIYNPTLRESKTYAIYSSINEDFIWNDELGLIKSENAELLIYNPITKSWDVLFSFANLGIKKITRFVFDSKNKRLAFVNNL